MVKEFIELSSGLLTPLIGVLTWLIFRQQVRVEKLKFNHELYDRRLEVYFALMEHLSEIFREARVGHDSSLNFNRKTREAYFLFDGKVADYLSEIYKKSIDLESYHERLHHENLPVGEERSRIAKEKSELLKWFGNQVTQSRKVFEGHLSLS